MLETIYYISGPALVIIASIGLWQLKIAKDNARLSAKRQSLTIAAERCDHFLNTIIPYVDDFDNTLEEKGIKFFDESKVEINGEKVKIIASCTDEELEKLGSISDKCLAVYNSLEALATFFTSGVADETVAFDSIGHSYCEIVKQYLPDIVPLSQDGCNYFNLLKLFFLWHERLVEIELLVERENIENKLKRINNKFISPLGTE